MINAMAEALEGRNALIQVQVDNHYYTRKVGDLNRLTENPRHVKVRSRESYIGWMRERIKEAEITVGTRYNHFATLRVLQQFQPKLTFDGLTESLPGEFEAYLRGKGYAVNTIAKYHKILRRYLTIAYTNDLISIHPYRKIKIKTEKTHKDTLTEREIRKLENHVNELDGVEKTVAKGFLFSVYTGLRYSDVMRVTRSCFKSKWLVMRMRKTGREVRIPVAYMFGGRAVNLIRETVATGNLFQMPANHRTNTILTKIMGQLGIRKHVTFHVARGTCATILLSRQCALPVIQTILGHQSIVTTEHYAVVRDATISREVRRAFRR